MKSQAIKKFLINLRAAVLIKIFSILFLQAKVLIHDACCSITLQAPIYMEIIIIRRQVKISCYGSAAQVQVSSRN